MSLAVGFNGARLTEARKSKALSATDLGSMIDISSTSLSKYENGHTVPRHEAVLRMSEVLNFPVDYFFRPSPQQDEKPVFWRSKLSANPQHLERARVKIEWLKEMVDYLADYFEYPQLDLPFTGKVENALELSNSDIEAIANEVRQRWSNSNGPLGDVLEKLEESGILVSRIHVKAEKVDACSQWSDRFKIPFIVLSRDKASACRQRFDALHELGHILLHRGITQKDLNNRPTYKRLEDQANQFASFMLLPSRDFADELYAPTLDGFASMKERWGASVGAMIMKCSQLDILSEDATRRLWINYTRRGWRDGEPFDGKTPKETPRLLRRSFEILLSEKTQTVSDILKALPFPPNDLEELADVEPGTFGGTENLRTDPVLKNHKHAGNVVSFPR